MQHAMRTVPLLAAVLAVSHAFYIPAILPVDYQTGDVVDLWYNKVYSEKTQLPFEYVRLPVCKPAEGERVIRENLGEILRGDRFIKSTYTIKYGEDVVCGVVCEPVPVSAEDATWLTSLITNEYKVEWYLDGLPAATPYRTTTTGRKLYEPGFRLGTVETINDEKNAGQTKIRTFLNNHVSIAILYNREDASISDAARIVGFEVYPRSISSEGRTTCPAEIADGMTPQEILPNKATSVLYTYSVEFREDKEVVWATRWDRFLINSDPHIHWYSIINSLIILLFLTGMVAVIMLRTLYNDISLYNDEESKEEEQDEVTGWKLVHGDIFRPPQYGWLLAVMVGTGVQFLGAVLTTVLFATVGVLNPSYRGGMGSFAVFLYVFMGDGYGGSGAKRVWGCVLRCTIAHTIYSAFGGYYSSRIYKAFRGTRWQWNAFLTALMFPGIIFTLLFLVNLFVWSQRSSSAIPFGTFVAIVSLWSGISLPLVMIGAYFGQKKKVNWFLTPSVSILVGGLLPFAAVFIELFFIMKSIWLDQYYYMYGFLAIVFIILLITCVEITIVIIYFTLCAEDYNWWWRSFFISSSSSLYIFLYAIYYYVSRLDITHFVPTLVYFASVFDACLIFFLCTGTIGFLSSYYFVIKIYSAVKVD